MTTFGLSGTSVADAHPDALVRWSMAPRRTRWGAIFIGAITAMGVQLMLTVLGAAVGITAAGVSDSGAGGEGNIGYVAEVGMAAGVWWLATGVLSLLVGGAVVGRTAGLPRGVEVLLHAFAMWAMTALVGVVLVGASLGIASAAGRGVAGTEAWGMAHHAGRPAPTDALPPGDMDGRPISPPRIETESARRTARAASWWTFGGLFVGASACVAGAWFAAPTRRTLRGSRVGP